MAREIILLKSYRELFNPEFCDYAKEACISLLQNPSDRFEREKYAIRVLSHIAPDSLIDNLVPLFKGVSRNRTLTYSLFTELLQLIDNEREEETQRISDALNFCQRALEEEHSFVSLSVDDILLLQHLINFIRRKLRIKHYRTQLSTESWMSVTKLWSAFIGKPGKVHPPLPQIFPEVIRIYSVTSFRNRFQAYYKGKDKFADIIEGIVPPLSSFADSLRPETKNMLTYFLSQGEETFLGDCNILDDSLRTLATLDSQRRLTDEHVDKVFYNNPTVNNAIKRLKSNAFDEDTSPLQLVLVQKFTDLNETMRRVFNKWSKSFNEKGIKAEYIGRETEVFVPQSVLEDILENFYQNINEYAFPTYLTSKDVRITVDQEIGDVLIYVCDNGKGISDADINQRPNGGIKRSQTLLAIYGGTVNLLSHFKFGAEEFTTVIQIRLLSKEKILWEEN